MGRPFREAVLLALMALVPAMLSGALQLKWEPALPPPRDGEVSAALARRWGKDVLWVDARPRADFERKTIPDAVLLNTDEWDDQIPHFLDRWNPDKAIVVFGSGSGDSALNIAHRLKEELKLEGVWVLQGGWDQWNTRR